ncbi:uncharacterized protein ACNS7B_024657 [Menidia menidia]
MGNCISWIRKSNKGESASTGSNNNNKPNEDVTYASINHPNVQEVRRAQTTMDNECAYATVNIPAGLQPEEESECSSKEECADDYVLME